MKIERESFKEYSEAAIVEKKESFKRPLLRGTSYVYINAGRYISSLEIKTEEAEF